MWSKLESSLSFYHLQVKLQNPSYKISLLFLFMRKKNISSHNMIERQKLSMNISFNHDGYWDPVNRLWTKTPFDGSLFIYIVSKNCLSQYLLTLTLTIVFSHFA